MYTINDVLKDGTFDRWCTFFYFIL